MKADGSVGSLLQGVSQQPSIDRLPGQCTLQENMSANPVTGLTRRPPTDLVAAVGTSTDASKITGWHNFTARNGNKFLVHVHDGTLEVVDLNGAAKTVTIDSAALPYISTTAGGHIRFSTDEDDSTMLVNTSVAPAMTSAIVHYFNTGTGSTVKAAALVQILGAQFGRVYTITINGTVAASYAVPDGSSTADSTRATSTWVAQQLETSLSTTGAITTAASWSWTIAGDVLLITHNPSTGTFDFTIEVDDGSGGDNAKALTYIVSDVADLPRYAPHLYVTRIAQNPDPLDDLWFKFIVTGQEASLTPSLTLFGSDGYWQETVAPNVTTTLDPATMPVQLTYDGTSFHLSTITWNARGVGTDKSNPPPSFVGNKINDVSTFQGRTAFISGSSSIMSRTKRPFDFFRGSIAALIATDPIDISTRDNTSTWFSMVQHNKDLVLFSPLAQGVIFGQTAATPQTAALVVTTRFESNINAHPVGAGRNVFFAVDFGRFTGIREFYAEGYTDINDSRPVTQHVNQYIEGSATLLAASANYDLLFVQTSDTSGAVYVYQYIWNDDTKVQAAWGTWFMPHNIVHMFFDGYISYFVQEIANKFYLLRMPLDVQGSVGTDYPVMLDQRFDVTAVHKTFSLPYNYLNSEELVVVQGTGCPNPGMTARIDSVVLSGSTYVVTLHDDMAGGNIIVGTKYKSRYRPTMPQVKDQSGASIGTGKLRARNLQATLSETGHIIGFSTSQWGDSPEVVFDARIVGGVSSIIGSQPLSDDTFILPFRQDVRKAEAEFYTDSHLPMTLIAVEWQGQYTKRGRRIAAPQGG